MTSKRYSKVGILAVLCAVVVGLAFASEGFMFGNSAARVRREHGLHLPVSASNFICGGDAWFILDRGAASAFEIAETDLPSFISQLKVRESSAGVTGSIFPSNSRYQIRIPWRASATGIAAYHCVSPTGDLLFVEVWRIDQARVGICLYTDWN